MHDNDMAARFFDANRAARLLAEWVDDARRGACQSCAHDVVGRVYSDLGVDSIRVLEALEAELSARLDAECVSLISEWRLRVARGLSPCAPRLGPMADGGGA